LWGEPTELTDMNEFQVAKERICKEIMHFLRPFLIKLYTRNSQSSESARLQCSALLFLVEENHNYRFDRMFFSFPCELQCGCHSSLARKKRFTNWSLTLRLLMSYIYIYGAPSKARNANVVYIWTYVWQR